jgi:hypothetical protein
MAISKDKFLAWAKKHWGSDIVFKGDEILLNSPFADDYKHHLSCNVDPKGDKHHTPYGGFRCFKSETKGTLIRLVMEVEKCTEEEAADILGQGTADLAVLEEKLAELLGKKTKVEIVEEKPIEGLTLPPYTYEFDDLPTSNLDRQIAIEYLTKRKIPLDGLMVCTRGLYRNRIVIPYYDREGKLIYYNCRLLEEKKDVPKYRGPPKELGVGKSDVIFMPTWPDEGKLYITEGEFDAMSIQMSGLNAAAMGGKELGDRQFEYLKPFTPVLCLDTDKAGGEALLNIGSKLKRKGISEVYFVRPPQGTKDWNDLFIKHGPKIVRAFILKNEKPYYSWTTDMLKVNRL